MELTKNNLFTVQVINVPIERNFQLIENEFKIIHQILRQLKNQNTSIIANVAQCMEFAKNIAKPQTLQKISLNMLLDQQKLMPTVQIKRTQSQTVNFQTQKMMMKKNSKNQKIYLPQEKDGQIQSIISQQILKDVTNIQQSITNNVNMSLEQKHQELIRSKTKKISIFNNNIESKSKGKDDLSFIQNKLRIFQANLLQEISELNKQLLEFKQTESVFKTKFQILEQQNQTFKKLLGIKKKNPTTKKQGQKKEQVFSKSKKNLQSKGNISLKTINQNGIQNKKISTKNIEIISENHSQNYQDDGQQNGILSLNKEIQKIRDYLNGKMKAIDQNFNLVNVNIQNIERNMEILQRTDYNLKEDLQALQQTCNQTKLSLGQINEKTMIKSRFRSNDILRDQNSQLNGIGRQPMQIQDRIIELLDQMEKLKSQYSLLFSQKGQQNDEENKQITEEILEKRKKLALKLNSNSSLDEKSKKQMASLKRDLRRLREEFDLLMNGVNTGSHETKTLIIKPNQTKQDWKSLTTKIYKTRQELLSIIKDLQTKIVANNDLTVVLNQMQVGIGQCKILLKKKVDIVQYQKTTKRIDNRLNNFIKQTFEKEGYTNEQDALITKQPWFCLSCDIQLKTYTGKVNKTLGNQSPTQKPMGKKVNPQSHMVRRNQNGRLPSLAL